MAEGIFRVLLKEKQIDNIDCTSCGTATFTGLPATDLAVSAAAVYGADIREHRSKPLSEYLVGEGDLFICMTQDHAAILSSFIPNEKIYILGGGIPDPFGGDSETYKDCAKAIYEGLLTLIEKDVIQ